MRTDRFARSRPHCCTVRSKIRRRDGLWRVQGCLFARVFAGTVVGELFFPVFGNGRLAVRTPHRLSYTLVHRDNFIARERLRNDVVHASGRAPRAYQIHGRDVPAATTRKRPGHIPRRQCTCRFVRTAVGLLGFLDKSCAAGW